MLRLRDIMSTGVVKLSPETTLREAMELFVAKHVGGAPVVSGDRVLGVLSSNDIMDFLSSLPGVPQERTELASRHELDEEPTSYWSEGDEPLSEFFIDFWSDVGAQTDERMRSVSGPEWNVLEEHTVSEAMNYGVISLPSGVSIEEAAEKLRSASVHRLLVIDDDSLVGIVSAGDLADAIAERGIGPSRVMDRVFARPRDDVERRSEA